MTIDYPIDQVPATPEYALELLEDLHRFEILDERPTFEMTISDLAAYLNDTILFWKELARSLRSHLGLDIPIHEWKAALSPMRKHTVRDLCEFIASRMGTRPAIRPWKCIIGECRPAGAFLTMRSLLARSGTDVANIAPSTPLRGHIRRGGNWLKELWRMAPMRIPCLVFHYRPWWQRLPIGLFFYPLALFAPLGLLFMAWGIVGLFMKPEMVSLLLAAVAMLGIGVLSFRFASRTNRPSDVSFEGCRTFRDLSYAIAGSR